MASKYANRRFHQSDAKVILNQCPAELKHQLDHPDQRCANSVMEEGSMLHQLLLGGDSQFHVMTATLKSGKRKGEPATDFGSEAARAERDQARKEGKIPVFPKKLEWLTREAERIRGRLLASGHDLRLAENEKKITWESVLGVPCEGTPDSAIMHSEGGTVVLVRNLDMKWGEAPNPARWKRKVWDQCLDVQAAAYEEAQLSRFPLARVTHEICAGQSGGAGLMGRFALSEGMMQIGRTRWQRAQEIWLECVNNDEWPEYAYGPIYPEPWMMAAMEV